MKRDRVRLNLQFAPRPEYAVQHAESIVKAANKIDGVDLDFSPGSLEAVDRIVLEMRTEGVAMEQFGETLFSFGCYVGEVFVRNNDAKWFLTEETPMKGFAAAPMVVKLGPDRHCNPIDKVFKLLENGTEDSVVYFYQVFRKSDSD